MMIKYINIVCFLLIAFSCSEKKALSPSDYIKYLNSEASDLVVTKELNGIHYKSIMRTPEFTTLTNPESVIKTKSDFDREIKLYKDQLNFIFLIGDSDKNNHAVKSKVFKTSEYGAILSYANTDLKNDFMLIQQKDTVFCSLLHLEPANSLEPLIRLSIAFNNIDTNSTEYTLVFNDNIFNSGPMKFNYSKQMMDKLPTLKM